MADLDSLIRVRKHNVEEKQKVLANLYEVVESLKKECDRLLSQRLLEGEKAKETNALIQGDFARYSAQVDLKVRAIDKKSEQLEKKISIAQDDVRMAFGDLKKIEIIDKRRKAEHLAEIEKREMDFLDEAAINGFLKNK